MRIETERIVEGGWDVGRGAEANMDEGAEVDRERGSGRR